MIHVLRFSIPSKMTQPGYTCGQVDSGPSCGDKFARVEFAIGFCTIAYHPVVVGIQKSVASSLQAELVPKWGLESTGIQQCLSRIFGTVLSQSCRDGVNLKQLRQQDGSFTSVLAAIGWGLTLQWKQISRGCCSLSIVL